MWSAYSILAKLICLVLLVETSSGRYFNPRLCKEIQYINKTSKTLPESHNQKYPYPYSKGNVTIQWDMMKETIDSYTAKITIFNYLKKHDLKGPWELGLIFIGYPTLLSTVGAKGTQGEPNIITDFNTVTFVGVPTQIIGNETRVGVIPSWFKEKDITKSSDSFEFSVVKYDVPVVDLTFTTPGQNFWCEFVERATNTQKFLTRWTTTCRLRKKPQYVFPPKIFYEDPDRWTRDALYGDYVL